MSVQFIFPTREPHFIRFFLSTSSSRGKTRSYIYKKFKDNLGSNCSIAHLARMIIRLERLLFCLLKQNWNWCAVNNAICSHPCYSHIIQPNTLSCLFEGISMYFLKCLHLIQTCKTVGKCEQINHTGNALWNGRKDSAVKYNIAVLLC